MGVSEQIFGDSMLRPFLQDTIRWWPLTATMAGMLVLDPISVFRVVPQVSSTASRLLGILAYVVLDRHEPAAHSCIDRVSLPQHQAPLVYGAW